MRLFFLYSVQSIHERVGKLSPESVDAVVNHLREGVPVFDVMEGSIDPLDKSVVIEGGPSLLSDGVWVWRNDLAYFVKKYRVGLPSEFLKHVFSSRKVDSTPSHIVMLWEEALEAYEIAEKGGLVE